MLIIKAKPPIKKALYSASKDKRKEYLIEKKEDISKYKKEYQSKNKQQYRSSTKKYQSIRVKTDPLFRLMCNLRGRVRSYCQAIKANKSSRTKEMIGLDLAGFKSHIESKFQEGMTWENYGQWHVDHIKPISLARNEQEIVELNHYTNLQPLWASENIKKSNKYEEASHDHGNYGESFL